MHVQATAKTDVGRVRERNEDAFLVEHALGLFAVADGMGGHAGGARASSLTVATLTEFMAANKEAVLQASEPEDQDPTPPLARLLADAVRAACATVYDAAVEDPSLAGMGTTCTVILVRPNWAYVAHVGDSRCYMQRGSRFMQVTEDHSLVNEQVRAGLLTAEAAAKSRLKNIITRSVGFEREVEVDTFLVPLQADDQFLLCSDGLSNLVNNRELASAMQSMHGEALVDHLIGLALERGGDDNVTVVTVQLRAEAAASQAPGPPAAAGEAKQTVPELLAKPQGEASTPLPPPPPLPRSAPGEAADEAPEAAIEGAVDANWVEGLVQGAGVVETTDAVKAAAAAKLAAARARAVHAGPTRPQTSGPAAAAAGQAEVPTRGAGDDAAGGPGDAGPAQAEGSDGPVSQRDRDTDPGPGRKAKKGKKK